jgi:hypothetical protein
MDVERKAANIPTTSRRAVPSVAGLDPERWSVEKGA